MEIIAWLLFIVFLFLVGWMLPKAFIELSKMSKKCQRSIFKFWVFYILIFISMFWFYGVFTLVQYLVAYFLRLS